MFFLLEGEGKSDEWAVHVTRTPNLRIYCEAVSSYTHSQQQLHTFCATQVSGLAVVQQLCPGSLAAAAAATASRASPCLC